MSDIGHADAKRLQVTPIKTRSRHANRLLAIYGEAGQKLGTNGFGYSRCAIDGTGNMRASISPVPYEGEKRDKKPHQMRVQIKPLNWVCRWVHGQPCGPAVPGRGGGPLAVGT